MDHYVSKQPCIHTWLCTRFQHTKCESKGKLKMMLKKNGHAISLKYSSKINMFFSTNYSKGGMHTITIKGRSSRTNFKWTLKDSEPELFILITSNKNGWKFNKNLKAIKRQLKPNSLNKQLEQCLLQNLSLTFHYKWGNKFAIGLKEPEGIQKNVGPKAFQNFPTKPNQKWQVGTKNPKEGKVME